MQDFKRLGTVMGFLYRKKFEAVIITKEVEVNDDV